MWERNFPLWPNSVIFSLGNVKRVAGDFVNMYLNVCHGLQTESSSKGLFFSDSSPLTPPASVYLQAQGQGYTGNIYLNV